MPLPRRPVLLLVATIAALALLAPVGANAHAHPDARTTATGRTAAGDPLLRRLRALPIVDHAREVPGRAAPGTRFFRIWVRLPVDPSDPDGPTFGLRATLTHVGLDRPTVLYASGYGVTWDYGYQGEVASLLDANQLNVEHRFFTPSRPRHPDWSTQLTIRKAAADQHRILRAFQRIYDRPWISTGASKGGMTVTYLRRFHPDDVAGTVAYVAPDDADNDEDARYADFLRSVGGDAYADCRDAIVAVQRRILTDRRWFVERLGRLVDARGDSLDLLGSAGRAVEVASIESAWAFWQYQDAPVACDDVPDAATTTDRRIWRWVDGELDWSTLTDQEIRPYVPYYYQAATQLGWPAPFEEPVADLLRHPGLDVAPTYVPRSLRPVTFRPHAMADVDDWVRGHGRRMLFVYGALDPWGAERFSCGDGGADRECSVVEQADGNHGASIRGLSRADRRTAIREVRAWAGLRTPRAALPRIEARAATGAREDRRLLRAQAPVVAGVLP